MTGPDGGPPGRGVRLPAGEPALLVSASVLGVSTTVSVVALRAVHPADLLAVEISGAAVLLLAMAALRRRLRWRGAPRQLLLGALMPGLVYLFADLGLARTSASSGSLLLAAEPLLAVLLALVVLRERLSGRAAVALAVGLAGGALVAFGAGGRDGTDSTPGNVLVLLAVVAAAVYIVATRRFHDADGLNASAWQNIGGALSVAPFVAGSWLTGGSRWDTAGAAGWLAGGAVVACGALASLAFNWGIARVPAVRAGQLRNLTPVVGTLSAVVFLGDRPSPLQLVGGTAILAGLVLLLRGAAGAHQPDTPPRVPAEELPMTDLSHRAPLFCDATLADRIERAEMTLVTARGDAARRRRGYRFGFAIAIAGGVANYAEPDSPLNKIAGLGFAGLPDPAGLDTVEQAFAAQGAPTQAEVASLAAPALLDLLACRGYRTVSFQNVLGRALGGTVEQVDRPGVEVHPSRDDEFEAWLDIAVEASLRPDIAGVPWYDDCPREIRENAERDTAGLVQRYLARFNGVPAGAGSMRIADGVAQLTGAGTAPAFRRRGIQSALLTTRLTVATVAGCDVAVITVAPGSKAQHNAERHGFNLLYTRAVLTKAPG
jgi:drug/metabolite transporter (DMT)-like permease/ribosomal protein S18 acetylase RimI-like enzyme